MEKFKQALLKPGPPESFALQVVQEAIKPQQTKLAQDENQLLENILRKLLQELVRLKDPKKLYMPKESASTFSIYLLK